jgi:cyclomaltodextrinase / maltogenic alpha-amylase / neopullulanase
MKLQRIPRHCFGELLMKSISRRLSIVFLLLSFALSCFAQTPAPARDYSKEKARPVVGWARDGVIYEVWERAFSPSGDFNGITARLDELKKTGIDILWLMPVNPIGEKAKKGTIGSPYAVRDYYGINPAYGTRDDLKRLIREAHARGMKVIVDVVFNHTAWDNPLVTLHPEYYHHDANGEIIYPADWTDVAWLDYSKPEVRAYIIDVMKYWIREYDLDGFRCDVAHMIPTAFWEEARVELEKIRPGLFLLAEAEDPDQMVKAFDSDYAWEMMHAINDCIERTKPATAIRQAWLNERKRFPAGTLPMRISDDHDESRTLVRFGENGALAAQAIVFTLDGIPLVYNGMEVGDSAESGAPALFEKVPITWGISIRRPRFPRFYSKMIALRKSSDALRRGDLQWLNNSDERRLVTFLRSSATERILVAVNASGEMVDAKIDGVTSGDWEDVTPDLNSDLSGPPSRITVPARVRLGPWGMRLLRQRMSPKGSIQ